MIFIFIKMYTKQNIPYVKKAHNKIQPGFLSQIKDIWGGGGGKRKN